jgi:hypothetical protein
MINTSSKKTLDARRVNGKQDRSRVTNNKRRICAFRATTGLGG